MPHFEVYFTVSYGLSRDQLEELNFLIKNSDPVKYDASVQVMLSLASEMFQKLKNYSTCQHRGSLEYSYSMYPGLSPPAVMFRVPLLMELFGAGFTKAPKSKVRTWTFTLSESAFVLIVLFSFFLSKHYELRFPRIEKVFRTCERSWEEGVHLKEVDRIAREAVGRDRPNKDVDDWANIVWGKPVSPGVRSEKKRKVAVEVWEEKLRGAKVDDGVKRKKRRWEDGECGGSVDLEREVFVPEPLGSRTNIQRSHRSSSVASNLYPVVSIPRLVKQSSGGVRASQGKEDLPVIQSATRTLSQISPGPICPATPTSTGRSRKARSLIPNHTWVALSPQTALAAKRTDVVPVQLPTPRPTPATLEGQRVSNKSVTEVTKSVAANSMTSFLLSSLVWLAKPCGSSCPSWRPSSGQIVPQGHRVHSLETLLIGCGWSEDGGCCEWVQRGVIFVDHDKTWKEYIRKRLEETKARGRPIWVFDCKILAYDALARVGEGEVEKQALYVMD